MDAISVTFLPQRTQLDLRPHESILDGLRRHGYSHRFGCRRGGCGQCKIDIVEGAVVYEVTVADSVLSADERAEGRALSCRAVPATDRIVVQLRNELLRRFLPW